LKPFSLSPTAGRLSRRDRILLIVLGILAVAWLATWPLRARLSRETARIEQDTAQKAQALRALERQKAEEAAARKRVAADPQNFQAHLALAAVLGRALKYPQAAQEARIAAQLNPQSAEPHVALGQIYDVSGLPDLAAEEFRRALELDPNNGQALSLLAYKYIAFGWNREAEQLLIRALKQLPNDPRLHVTLGMVYFQNNDFRASERELLTARRLDPQDASSIGPLIEVYRHAQRYPDALKTIDEALKILPDKGLLLLERAQIYIQMRNAPAAIDAANQALQLHPGNIRALYIRGVAEKMLGQTDAALRDLEQVRAADSHTEQVLLHLGQLYIQKGETQKGAELLKQHKQDHTLSDTLARLTLGVTLKPNDINAHRALAREYYRVGSLKRAIVEYKRILEMQPDDQQARRQLAQALHDAGRQDEANALTASLSP